MKTQGYSINILPSGEEYTRFDDLIKKLANEYRTLPFAPHITLLGQAAEDEHLAIKLMEELTANQEPFSVTLDKIGYQDYFFRALYVLVDKTSSLLTLHEKAKKIFEKESTALYMPHLSLLYAENFSIETKEKIIREIGAEQPSTFTIKSLHLFKTEGESNEWYPVKQFLFKPS